MGPASQAWECGGALGWNETWLDARGAVGVPEASGAAGRSSDGTIPAAGGGAAPRSKLAQNEHSCAEPDSSDSWLCATCMNEARPTASARAATSRRRRSQPGSRQGEKSAGR